MVAGEQQEETVADHVEGERATLPDPEHVRLVDAATEVVDLEVAVESGARGELSGIDRFDRAQVEALGRELGEDLVPARIAERIVVVVQAQPGGQDRIVLDEPSETRLDEVVEGGISRPHGRVDGGTGQRLVAEQSDGHMVLFGGVVAAGDDAGAGGSGRPAASWRRARVRRRR